MYRVKDRQKVPPKPGYTFVCPHCQTQFAGNTLGRVARDVSNHFIANQIVVPSNIIAVVENDHCQRRPQDCEPSEASRNSPPPLIQQAANFAHSIWRWAKEGAPMVTQEEFDRRKSLCESCNHWHGWREIGVGRCNLCGCATGRYLPKLWMATEKCPDKTPKW